MKKNKKFAWIIGVLVCVLVVSVIAALCIPGGEQELPEETVGTTPAETTVPETEPVLYEKTITDPDAMIELETPYCALYFPRLWEDHLHINLVEGDGCTMQFSLLYGEETYPLFDVSFVSGDGTLLGEVMALDGSAVKVYLKCYDLEAEVSDEIAHTFWAMQEDVNELVAWLPLGETVSEEVTVTPVEISTPYGTLFYPAQWGQYLSVEQAGEDCYAVRFSAAFASGNEVHLFDVLYGSDEAQVATVGEVPVSIVVSGLDVSELSEEEAEIAYSMQEAVNDLIEQLSAN